MIAFMILTWEKVLPNIDIEKKLTFYRITVLKMLKTN